MGGADALDDLAGIDALVERGDADPERIGVTGGSYGGFMSCWLPTLDQRFKASVAISPVTDYFSQHWNSNIGAWDSWFVGARPGEDLERYRDRSPVFFADRVSTPTLLTAGTEDAARRRARRSSSTGRSWTAASRRRSRSIRARVTGSGSSRRSSTRSRG